MENRQILDLKALTAFKENLFEKKIGGLSTSYNASGEAYDVHWDAYSLDLGKTLRYGTGQSDDAYCTFSVSNAFVDNLTFYANAGNHTLEELFMDVYRLSDRVDALGFKEGTADYTRNGSALSGTTSGIPLTKIGKAALLTASMATYNFNIPGTIRLNIPEGFRPSPSKKPTLYFYDGLPNAEMPFRGGYPYSWASDCSYIEFEADGSNINNIANPSLGWELP